MLRWTRKLRRSYGLVILRTWGLRRVIAEVSRFNLFRDKPKKILVKKLKTWSLTTAKEQVHGGTRSAPWQTLVTTKDMPLSSLYAYGWVGIQSSIAAVGDTWVFMRDWSIFEFESSVWVGDFVQYVVWSGWDNRARFLKLFYKEKRQEFRSFEETRGVEAMLPTKERICFVNSFFQVPVSYLTSMLTKVSYSQDGSDTSTVGTLD